MVPSWFRLIHYFHTRPQGIRRYGVTLPFIIGALRDPIGAIQNHETSWSELLMLVRAMGEETPEDYQIRISRCDHIGQPIVTPYTGIYQISGIPIVSLTTSRHVVFVAEEFVRGSSTSLETLAARLWEECSGVIDSGRFSFRSGDYRSYSDDDLQAIRESQSHHVATENY